MKDIKNSTLKKWGRVAWNTYMYTTLIKMTALMVAVFASCVIGINPNLLPPDCYSIFLDICAIPLVILGCVYAFNDETYKPWKCNIVGLFWHYMCYTLRNKKGNYKRGKFQKGTTAGFIK